MTDGRTNGRTDEKYKRFVKNGCSDALRDDIDNPRHNYTKLVDDVQQKY